MAFWSTLLSFFGLRSSASDNHLEKCSDPPNAQQSILFIGNSFTYYDNMPLTFSKIAKERFPYRSIKVYSQVASGYKLWQHARDKDTRPTLMNSGKWDIVVLQEQSEMALESDTLKAMRQSCIWFDRCIKQVHGRTALLMTWSDLDKPQDQPRLSQAYREIGREIGAVVIPAGELFLEVTRNEPSIMLYDQDKHHPSHYGSFLVACLAEDILLQNKTEIADIVARRKYRGVAQQDPIEQKLKEWADQFAIRELSSYH